MKKIKNKLRSVAASLLRFVLRKPATRVCALVRFEESVLLVQYQRDELFQLPGDTYPPWKSTKDIKLWPYIQDKFLEDTGVKLPDIYNFIRSAHHLRLLHSSHQRHIVFEVEARPEMTTALSESNLLRISDFAWFQPDDDGDNVHADALTVINTLKNLQKTK